MPGDDAVDVSSYEHGIHKLFSPFSYNPANMIPVPGNEKMHSDSVEGIWQGLKVINGSTDYSLFHNKPYKRKGEVNGHQFGNEILNCIDARKQIYIPAYTHYVINSVIEKLYVDLESRLEHGNVFLCDVDTNNDINDTSKPLSHAAVLTDILNLLCDAPLPPFNKVRYNYLDEQLKEVMNYYKTLCHKKRSVLEDIISFAYLFSQDELKQTFALKAIAAGVQDNGRLENYAPTPITQDIFHQLRR